MTSPPEGLSARGETSSVSRRQLIKRGALIGTAAIWVPPVVQSIRMPAFGQVGSPGPPPEPCVGEGFMTGSGYAYIAGTAGPKVHYTTQGQLHCTPDPSDKVSVDWDNGVKGNAKIAYEFNLTAITAADCTDNPLFEDPGPTANFNQTSGAGIGTYSINNVVQPGDATIIFKLIDGGEPGIGADVVTITIEYPSNTVVLNVVDQPLTQGNLQTHGNEAFGDACP